MQYWQLGGFRPKITWTLYDDKLLAQMVAGVDSPLRLAGSHEPVELILGIRSSGASCLLLSEPQVRVMAKAFRLSLPHPKDAVYAAQFISISPIHFYDERDLLRKLTTLRPKSKKGQKNIGDTSQANRQFEGGQEGISRGMFEHGRVLYRLLTNNLDVQRFDLHNPSIWLPKLRICSLVFNTWRYDFDRPHHQRQMHPKVLDFGFSSLHSPHDFDEMTSYHLIVGDNIGFKNGTQHTTFSEGTTETLKNPELGQRLSNLCSPDPTQPTILLVYDEELTRNALKDVGVESSAWVSGIRDLFWDSNISYHARFSNVHHYIKDSPKRSSSPERFSHKYDNRSRYSDTKHPSPSQSQHRDSVPKSYAPVYVVDVQHMYVKLFQTHSGSKTGREVAKELRLLDGEKDGPTDGWCAGIDSRQIIEAWHSMVSGASIDDQRAFRLESRSREQKEEASETLLSDDDRRGGVEHQDNRSDDENDQDPNDLAAAHQSQAVAGPSQSTGSGLITGIGIQDKLIQSIAQSYAQDEDGGDYYYYDDDD